MEQVLELFSDTLLAIEFTAFPDQEGTLAALTWTARAYMDGPAGVVACLCASNVFWFQCG